MLGEEDKDQPHTGENHWRAYSRSVSWNDRSPTKPNSKPQVNSKSRVSLPPLQPLSISRPKVEEWPCAGCDDLGVWPHPPTPRVGIGSHPDKPAREFEFQKDKLAFFDKECSRILDHVYLGSESVAKNREILRENKITHVLNCVGFICPEYFKNDLVYKTLWLQDSPSEDITSILYNVFDYLEDVRERNGRAFIHCCRGISRSNSLVIAYLMWRNEQSFEDAFQYVKSARGVTNPNMGFTSQLLQCQKRVQPSPSSPSAVLRMYRLAPHSSYDPLHLVPKLLNDPKIEAFDSRGSFIIHVTSAIYVWVGKNCITAMSDSAKAAASQVVRYERAKGPVFPIKEGEEPDEFWNALGVDKTVMSKEITCKKVNGYDLDFEIFHKAEAGGVVPPSAMFDNGSETCLPLKENGWGKLRRKLSNGSVKDFVATSLFNYGSNVNQSYGSPSSPKWISSIREEMDHPLSKADSFSYLSKDSKFNTSSPLLSPSASDYSNSFSFSPSSSNWSELSFLSAQPSPSGLEPTDFNLNPYKNSENACSLCKEISFSAEENLLENNRFGVPYTCLPCSRGISAPSIAERRGNNPPPPMVLPSVEEVMPKSLIRSWSFSLPDLEDSVMEDIDQGISTVMEREEAMMDAENQLQNGVENVD